MQARSRAGANGPQLHEFPVAKCVDRWIKAKQRYAKSVTSTAANSGLSMVIRRLRKKETIQSASSIFK